MTVNKNHKIVKVTQLLSKLGLAKVIESVTGKSLTEAQNIVNILFKDNESGTLLLNESSITVKQWEKIAKSYKDMCWEYVE